MIHLKPIHYSMTPNQHVFFNRSGHFQRKDLVRCLCKSNDSNSDSEATPPPPTPPQGDSRQQELLARIAQLQTQKVRLTDYLDERSAYLSQFAEDANTEIDQIGENALKELDEAGERIMGNIESQMQAFEESVELNKQEIEENEKKLADFVDQMEEEKNEGLFFKNLGQKQPVDKAKAKKETKKIKQLNKEIAESNTRKNIYLALMGLVVVGITNALISSPSDLGKSAVLGVILVGLLSQVIYEQKMLSETETKQKQTSEEEKSVSKSHGNCSHQSWIQVGCFILINNIGHFNLYFIEKGVGTGQFSFSYFFSVVLLFNL